MSISFPCRWTIPYVSDEKAQVMKTLLETNNDDNSEDKLQIKYSTYDWQLNGKGKAAKP